MVQPLETLHETASQTAGPYVHIGCIPSFAGLPGIYPEDLGRAPFSDGAQGEVVTITGAVLDAMGAPLRDAMLESWQADASGCYPGTQGADPHVSGFCRFAADKDTGEFTLRTIRPGAVMGHDGRAMAPHISLWIVARGINIGLHTRLYFEDADNSADPLMSRIDPPARAATLIAARTAPGAYRFDIRLQGADETVFLDI
jgi:protocatechuate 3,4-dioxygenase alpha subunit